MQVSTWNGGKIHVTNTMYNNVQQFDTSNSFALHNLWLQYNMQMVVKKEEMY